MLKKITSLQHPLIKHLVKLRKNSDYRFEHRSLVIEGIKLVHEVCSQYEPKQILISNENLIPESIPEEKILLVSEEIINKITGLENSEGVLAEVPMPLNQDLNKKKYLLALDRVMDPGNMGTLLRTALALGWEGAFILEGSCDPFNEKVLRSSRGGVFRLPLSFGNWDQLQNLIKKNNLMPYAADLEGHDIEKITFPEQGVLLVLSNEAQGLTDQANQLCQKVTIPIPGEMESLNVAVAGGILMYSLKLKN